MTARIFIHPACFMTRTGLDAFQHTLVSNGYSLLTTMIGPQRSHRHKHRELVRNTGVISDGQVQFECMDGTSFRYTVESVTPTNPPAPLLA